MLACPCQQGPVLLITADRSAVGLYRTIARSQITLGVTYKDGTLPREDAMIPRH